MRAAFAILLVPSLASAGVAELSDDVDANGSPDRIELTADGVLHIGDASKTDVKIAPSASKAKVAVAKQPTGAQIVVDVTAGQTREGVVLDRKGGWHVALRFPLGGVGLDREYGIEVDATPTGIYRYQTRFGFQRCDDAPAYLFGEKLDLQAAGGAAWKRLDKLPTLVPAGAQLLQTKPDSGPAPAPLVFQAKAASYQRGATDAGGLAIPSELDDGRPETQWREDLASNGEGQFFTFRARVDKQHAQLLRIVAGDPTGRTKPIGRPKAMGLVSKQGAWRFEVPEADGAYAVELPPTLGDCVTVVIESGTGRGPTSIAELGIYAEGERASGGEVALARIVAEGKGDTTGAAEALRRRGAAAVAAIDAELGKLGQPDREARGRLIAALVKINDPSATASLVRAASEGWVRDRDLLDLIAALAKSGQVASLHDLAAKGALPLAARVAAIKGIEPRGAGFTALTELAGFGPRELRKETIARLSLAPVAQLSQAAAAAAAAPASGDLWRAATRAAKLQQAARAGLVATMLSALPTTTDYERRYRLIDGIATHGDAQALAVLAQTLRAFPNDTESSALRQIAIRGIASTPRSEAAALVINFTRDPDPGVRLAAIAALATADTEPAGPWHPTEGPDAIDRVLQNGMYDSWPEIRRRAATSLGARCTRPGPAKVLFEAVSKDKAIEVRLDAMLALVTCKADGVRELLPFVWDSRKHPLPQRLYAVQLVVPLADMELAKTLVKKFASWRGQSLESTEALELAKATAPTLGLMKPPGAAQVLLDALDDVAFPELVAAAALALGELGPACPAAAKAKLGVLARSEDQSSIAAKRALARCGK